MREPAERARRTEEHPRLLRQKDIFAIGRVFGTTVTGDVPAGVPATGVV